MIQKKFSRVGALALAFGVTLGACDQLPTTSEVPDRSRVLLRSGDVGPVLSSALLSRAGGAPPGHAGGGNKGNGPIDLSTIAAIDVQFARIALLVEGSTPVTDDSADNDDSGDRKWIDLQLAFDPTSTWFDLRNIRSDLTLGLVPETFSGEIRAVRLYFGDARVAFVDGTEEDLFIPSGKVTIPTAGVTVNQGQDVAVVFESVASIRKIIRTGNGLLMPPVFVVENGRGGDAADHDDDDADDDEDSDDDDDADDDDDTEDDTTEDAGTAEV